MKIAASLPPEDIAPLAQLLEKERIPCETRLANAESGLEITDLMVDDSDYERACETIENWLAARADEERRKSTRPCPKCKSQDWETVEDAHYQKAGLAVIRCKACGCLVPC